jgi:hypothetical protein
MVDRQEESNPKTSSDREAFHRADDLNDDFIYFI